MKNSKGTHWVLLARDVTYDATVLRQARRLYNDIAMIGHNPKSGRTCFFQNRISQPVAKRGYYIPHPADAKDSDGFWRPPGSNGSCLACHSADPFNHSPWIDQAKKANGAHVVPRGMDPAYPDFANLRGNPYTILGAAGFRKQGNNPNLFRIPKQLAPSPDAAKNACLSCHRAAEGEFLTKWVNRSVNGGDITGKLTGYALEDQHRLWMPLGSGDSPMFTSAAAFKPYQPSVDHLTHCGASPSAPDCDWVDAPGAQ